MVTDVTSVRGGLPVLALSQKDRATSAQLTEWIRGMVEVDVAPGTHLELIEPSGTIALLDEMVVLGRTGEVGGALYSRQRITLARSPLLVEDLDFRCVADRSLPGVLGGRRVLCTTMLLGLPLSDRGGRARHPPGAAGDAGALDRGARARGTRRVSAYLGGLARGGIGAVKMQRGD